MNKLMLSAKETKFGKKIPYIFDIGCVVAENSFFIGLEFTLVWVDKNKAQF